MSDNISVYSISDAADFLEVSQVELLLMWKWHVISMEFDLEFVPYFLLSELIRVNNLKLKEDA